MATTTRASISAALKLNNTAFKKGLGNSKKELNKFSSSVKSMGGILAGAFTARAIANFTIEASKLAATMEGVAVAFERISPSIGFMQDLKAATSGTVSELDLMRRSVMASNFKIPMDQLASLLKFATKRAQETGESVDYLVNSIVIGIGRKSPLILDNLGISAVELRKKLDHVGHSGATVGDVAKAVGEIATESMADMGDVIETTAIKWERLNAEITDAKVEFGKAANVLINAALPAITKLAEEAGFFAIRMKDGADAMHAARFEKNFAEYMPEKLEREVYYANLWAQELMMVNDGMTESEALIRTITDMINNYHYMLGNAWSDANAKRYEMFIEHFKKWREDLQKVPEDTEEVATGLKALRENLKMLKEQLEIEPSPGLVKQIKELEQIIKNFEKYGQALPPVLTPDFWEDSLPDPMTTDELNSWAGGLFDNDPETWIESLRRRREESDRFRKSLGEMGEAAKEAGNQIGVMLVNSFSNLGSAIGEAISGVDGAMKDLASLILENIGNILIMAGLSTSPIGWPLVIAGAAIQFGGGIMKGIRGSSSTPGGSGSGSNNANVLFRLQGKDLVGAINRHNDYNFQNT